MDKQIRTGSKSIVANYSPDQPRDERGRFAESAEQASKDATEATVRAGGQPTGTYTRDHEGSQNFHYGMYKYHHGEAEKSQDQAGDLHRAAAEKHLEAAEEHGKAAVAAETPKLPGKSKWSTFSGGIGAARDRNGMTRSGFSHTFEHGRYVVDPITTFGGRHAGYKATFQNDKGAIAGGLNQDLGTHGSANDAIKAAQAHHAENFGRTGNPEHASQNQDFGYFGTTKLHAHTSDAETHADFARARVALQQRFSLRPSEAREALDARYGRHMADAVHGDNLSPYEAAGRMGHPAKWSKTMAERMEPHIRAVQARKELRRKELGG